MALQLPGETGRPHLLEVVLAIGTVLGLCALGCGTPTRTRRLSPSVFQSAHQQASKPRRGPTRPVIAGPGRERGDESAAMVERTLHQAGLRFGTDGSTGALWGYLRTAHKVVAPTDARPGDIVFFDTRGRAGTAAECADHTGIVEKVDLDGRISFIETRGGQVKVSYAHPAFPLVRRDQRGEVLNTFLRPKKINDPPDARYFAGEMLCGVARVTR